MLPSSASFSSVLVAQHLRAWIAYSGRDCDLFYWWTRAGVEIDFVIYGEGGFWAVEIKNTSKVRSQDLRALRSFREDYPEYRPPFIYRGSERLLIDGTLCVPGEEISAEHDAGQWARRPFVSKALEHNGWWGGIPNSEFRIPNFLHHVGTSAQPR